MYLIRTARSNLTLFIHELNAILLKPMHGSKAFLPTLPSKSKHRCLFRKVHFETELENGTRRAQIPRKPLIFPSPNKQTDKQKILAILRFELSTLAFLAQCSYRLSYRAVLIWFLLSDYYYRINKKYWPHRGSNSRPSRS